MIGKGSASDTNTYVLHCTVRPSPTHVILTVYCVVEFLLSKLDYNCYCAPQLASFQLKNQHYSNRLIMCDVDQLRMGRIIS